MTLSIITTTFNSASTVADTIRSINYQTFANIEHIFIDGSSKDETLSVIKNLSPNSIIISEPDNGLYDAMNKGIEIASGDLIGILNSDDFYTNNDVLTNVVKCFETQNCDLLYGNLIYVDQNNTNKILRKWVSRPWRKNKFLYGWMPPHPTIFVKKHIYKEFGTFNTNLQFSADYEFMLRTMYFGKDINVCYLPQYLVTMRAGGASNSSLRNRISANLEDRIAWKLNGFNPPLYTTLLKPLRKIPQYFSL